MEKIKCGQCGLVNWQGAVSCARCKGSLGTGVNTFENGDAAKGGSKLLFVGLAVAAVACIGFGVYQTVAPAPQAPAAPQAQVENTAPVIDQQKVQQMISEQDKKAGLEVKKMLDQSKQWAEGPKFDKKLMEKSVKVPQVQNFPQVPPGGFGPPGAGVPYHTR